ncbi:DEAD/DEAH box helicase [Paraburkholderia sp. GAS33]|uniref:DEAD/DEAH box helicase n=1 Tax=Paraburkholderia sp. GAS33 TaxID=3035130 RepID=UPI003D208ADF
MAEVSLLHPEVAPESKPILIGESESAWQITSAEPDVASWVRAQFAASKAHSDTKSAKTIPFVLIAARLSEAASHGVKWEAGDIHKGLSVLCIPCLLDKSGGLWPDPDRHPWIPRDLLEPTLRAVSVGSLERYDEFVSGLPGRPTSLGETLQIAANLFEAVTDARLPLLRDADDEESMAREFSVDGYELVSAWHGIPYEPPIVAKHLIRLYDHIIDGNPNLPLLDNLRTIDDRPSRLPTATQDAQKWHANTVGHMNRQYPLSPSQREAMVELSQLGEGKILAVNGPPGTGKTTLLQSVVAQVWVDAALRAAECPLIVVASTNVKAVENVLDCFARISAETGHERWHPYARGFGLFLASESRESHHPTCTSRTHPFSEYETPDAVDAAEKLFLEKASAAFRERQELVAEVVEKLQGDLQFWKRKLNAIVAARYEVFHSTGQVTADGAAKSCKHALALYQERIDAEQAELDAVGQGLSVCRADAEVAEHAYEETRRAIDAAERRWVDYLAHSPLWLDLLAFLPPIRQRRMARDRSFLMADPITAERKHRDDSIESHFAAIKQAAVKKKAAILSSLNDRRVALDTRKSAALERRRVAEAAQSKINSAFLSWQGSLKGGFESMLDVSLDALNDQLDVMLRARMFPLADWYWTGRWILEMRDRLRTGKVDKKSRAPLEAKYRRFAKLSPCLVSNFHMAPAFFTAWQGEDIPFWNAIDLLIVDEAGQVSPDIGASMFALAKRALVVGDIYQIEPVWNNGEATDRANAVKFGLTAEPRDPRYNNIAEAGYTPACGNVMRIANRSCTVQKFDDMRGLMLTEHRRCVPELIDYCNKLIYSNRLQPKRPSIEPEKRLLPAFGYLGISARDKRVGKSRQNYDEAKAIVGWLKANRTRIEAHYRDEIGAPTPLWKLVGIITPFASQAGVIERALRSEIPDLTRKGSRLTVGTVHALQGAERAIVIFSPTYGESHTGGTFFDQGPNMLNVAVSRAKDSFLVIGNLALFDVTKRSRCSGLLASYLFHGRSSAALEDALTSNGQ